MLELDKIYNMDCIEGMGQIEKACARIERNRERLENERKAAESGTVYLLG